jgi:hypothetical protein
MPRRDGEGLRKPRILQIEVEGKTRLGFDTGLTAQAFAQAKIAQFITSPGVIIEPGGTGSIWRAEGVTEYFAAGSPDREGNEASMVVWGPGFRGKRLDRIIEEGDEDALDALRYWVRARGILDAPKPELPLESPEASPFPAPAAAILTGSSPGSAFSPGTILFPPARLTRRALEAEGSWFDGAEQWTHPDLTGEAAAVFAAAAMLYRIVCGEPPYPNKDPEGLYSDLREGVYIPPNLAAPGLDKRIADLISRALAPVSAGIKRPSLEDFADTIGSPLSGGKERFFHALSGDEKAKLESEREKFSRQKTAVVKTRRFIRRNTAILGGVIAGLAVLALVIGSIVSGNKNRPNTRGMEPREVIGAYYGAFETLDHTLMDACVINKAGKGDVDMIMNMFVISKVREAYEMRDPLVPARIWLDAGSAPTDLTVVGVTGLHLDGEDEDESDGEVRYRADYTLWLPASMAQDTAAPPVDPAVEMDDIPPVMPVGTVITDDIRLVFQKDAWRIAEIRRETRDP